MPGRRLTLTSQRSSTQPRVERVTVSGRTVVLTLSSRTPVSHGAVLSYEPPNNAKRRIRDLAGNEAVRMQKQVVDVRDVPVAPAHAPSDLAAAARNARVVLTWSAPTAGGAQYTGGSGLRYEVRHAACGTTCAPARRCRMRRTRTRRSGRRCRAASRRAATRWRGLRTAPSTASRCVLRTQSARVRSPLPTPRRLRPSPTTPRPPRRTGP